MANHPRRREMEIAPKRPRGGEKERETPMYMVSWIEDEGKVEASLGGRVTAEEMHVFAEELKDVLTTFGERPYVLTIDHSKAKPFDPVAQRILSTLKDDCLAANAQKIVTMVEDEDEMAVLTDQRLQAVLEGREEILFAAVQTEWQGVESYEIPVEVRKAA